MEATQTKLEKFMTEFNNRVTKPEVTKETPSPPRKIRKS